ncbi:MAG: hypothetical protein KAI91_04845, partial [Candidatus Omnitrophica bacterium]|nr:hypothetical protein [Candidatus Omnitrophota bacterium]
MKDEKKYNYKYNENVGAVIAPNRNNIRLSKIENKRPLFVASISAGFPSPADDFIDRKLDLNEFLIK